MADSPASGSLSDVRQAKLVHLDRDKSPFFFSVKTRRTPVTVIGCFG